MQSSRVGVSTRPWTPLSSGSTYSSMGRPNAAVLPLPVWAWPITSRPSRSGGMAWTWIGLGDSYPTSRRAASMDSESPRSAKEGIRRGAYGLGALARPWVWLAPDAGAGDVERGLLGRRGLRLRRLEALPGREQDHPAAVADVDGP